MPGIRGGNERPGLCLGTHHEPVEPCNSQGTQLVENPRVNSEWSEKNYRVLGFLFLILLFIPAAIYLYQSCIYLVYVERKS